MEFPLIILISSAVFTLSCGFLLGISFFPSKPTHRTAVTVECGNNTLYNYPDQFIPSIGEKLLFKSFFGTVTSIHHIVDGNVTQIRIIIEPGAPSETMPPIFPPDRWT